MRKNKDFYLRRLEKSYLQFQNDINFRDQFEYYAIVDGIINDIDYKDRFPCLNNVKFINNTPVLGIKSNTRFFAGWKRSLKVGLQLLINCDKLLYIDNDCKVLNFNKIKNYLDIPDKNFSADMMIHEHMPWMESSLIVINDKKSRQDMIDFYSKDENVFNEKYGDVTEVQVQKVLKPEYVFYSRRTFSAPLRSNDNQLDFLSNYWHFSVDID